MCRPRASAPSRQRKAVTRAAVGKPLGGQRPPVQHVPVACTASGPAASVSHRQCYAAAGGSAADVSAGASAGMSAAARWLRDAPAPAVVLLWRTLAAAAAASAAAARCTFEAGPADDIPSCALARPVNRRWTEKNERRWRTGWERGGGLWLPTSIWHARPQ